MTTPCPSCGADQWPGRVCCDGGWRELHADAMTELREARIEVALMRQEIESQERAHAEERERWRALVQWHRRCNAYDLGKLQWLGHGHHGGRPCAACAAYEAKVGAEPPLAPLEPSPAQN